MKLEAIFENFEQFADIPESVGKLREVILHLAATGGILPRSGEWEKRSLKALATKIGSGATPAGGRESYLSKGIPLIRSMNVHFRGFKRDGLAFLSETQADELSNATVRANDVLLNITGASIGRVTVAPDDMEGARVNQHVTIIRPSTEVLPRFLSMFLASPMMQRMIDDIQVGATRQALTKGMIEQFQISLPPLNEQKQIITKVDELMGLCDRLELQQRARVEQAAQLTRAAVARFNDVPSFANLQLLFNSSCPVPATDLRNSILTLAVKGKLAPQDPNDEPAEMLLSKVENERRHFAEEHKFRFSISGSIDKSLHPFDIPSTWKWCRLSSLFNAITDGDHLPPPKSDGGVAFLTIGNISTGKLQFEASRFVPDSYYQGLATFRRPKLGDILYTVVGTYGRAARVETDRPFCVQRHIAILKPPQCIETSYLMAVLRSPLLYEQATASATGTAQPTVSLSSLRNFIAPLPPLMEQRRIVAKIQQLMALVDTLEKQIEIARTSAVELLSSLVAELTGHKHIGYNQSYFQKISVMKTKANESLKRRNVVKPLALTTRSFVLRRFAMSSGYRSLGDFDCSYHLDETRIEEASPICLVGLNGSGKSNLIEAIAEVFCFLELINLPWKKVESPSSRYRENRHRFELEYKLEDGDGRKLIRIRKSKKTGADFYVVLDDGAEVLINSEEERLRVLPRRIIGYSSGLNETVSHPFLRTKTIYSEEVRDAAPPGGAEPSGDDTVFDTRTLYMDYESNAAILISNYIFRKASDLSVIEEFTRVQGVASFGIRFNRKRAGKSGAHSTVRLTQELRSYLRSFVLCAGAIYDETQISYDLKFSLTPECVKLFRQEFGTAERLFMAMHKWSLLNALILSDQQRKVYLSTDISKGALERPPSVPPSDRVFDIIDLRLKLSNPKIEIDYSGLSDGEHQFIQVFGTALLFSEPGTLFLFDEPESHFNPEWRTRFNLILNRLPNAEKQEYIISTHSPYIVSGSRQSNVYKFKRAENKIAFSQVDFETYGASFDVLLKNLFSIDSLIDQSARQDLENIIKRGDMNEMQQAVDDFAESKEKRRLYEAIIQKEEN